MINPQPHQKANCLYAVKGVKESSVELSDFKVDNKNQTQLTNSTNTNSLSIISTCIVDIRPNSSNWHGENIRRGNEG